MIDHKSLIEECFSERERTLRQEVGELINRYCTTTGKSHSFAWRKAYLELEDETGFRGPDKKTLDAIEKAGLMPQLLDVAKRLSGACADHGSEVNKGIPDYVPHRSDREGWKPLPTEPPAPIEMIPYRSDREAWSISVVPTKQGHSCQHEWGVFSTVLEDATLLVQCVECGAYGRVCNPTAEEWQLAFHAPSNPYHWPDNERVELLPGRQEDESKRHIRRNSNGRRSTR